MSKKLKLIDAVKEVLKEDPRTKEKEYQWTFFVKVMEKMGYPILLKFSKDIPSPDSITRAWRNALHNPNKNSEFNDFIPEPNTTYTKPEVVL